MLSPTKTHIQEALQIKHSHQKPQRVQAYGRSSSMLAGELKIKNEKARSTQRIKY